MPRLQTITPDQATDEVASIYDHYNRRSERVPAILQGIANSPAALNAYTAMDSALKRGQLDAKERETLQLVSATINDCRYCLAAHTAGGKQAGLTDQQMIGLRAGNVSDAKLQALAAFARQVLETRGDVSEDDVRRIREAGYSDGQIVEIIANLALANFTNHFNRLNHTDVDFAEPPQLPGTT